MLQAVTLVLALVCTESPGVEEVGNTVDLDAGSILHNDIVLPLGKPEPAPPPPLLAPPESSGGCVAAPRTANASMTLLLAIALLLLSALRRAGPLTTPGPT